MMIYRKRLPLIMHESQIPVTIYLEGESQFEEALYYQGTIMAGEESAPTLDPDDRCWGPLVR